MHSLIKNTLQNEAKKTNGIYEEVEYIHLNAQSVFAKAIIEYPKFEEKKGKDVASSIIFHSLELNIKPNTADIVKYDGDRYIVTEYKKVSSLYDVTAVSSQHNRGR